MILVSEPENGSLVPVCFERLELAAENVEKGSDAKQRE